ncbi:hypothetical protein [Methylobacterium sp. V23]|uniref:sacsin N-terminal ATP-binding-like domain-containing protein n=1 Tax=Methylobacterium sp. V23 TaxID=2044878 RepID=UPI000CDAC125|nr:hypothetical protein [Methylobacterium sp. V23]POR41168.1 hypothetical protein CRT23_20085 [Methylobacterium sp. V23]
MTVSNNDPHAGGAVSSEETWSAEWWADFLKRELATTRDVFRLKPRLLLGQGRSERQTAGDYAGRELLELVQNAADAATEGGGNGRVLIDVGRQGLIVANTGQPFRSRGVESLMTPNASDKPGRNATLIGAKGLGFRALLNWSHEPVVSSGHLEIAFSSAHAARQIRALAAENEEIAKILAVEEEFPAPVLGFPAFGPDIEGLPNGPQRSLLKKSREHRQSGYDTVIAAPFDDQQAYERAVVQADEFDSTFLLFVPSLVEIALNVEGRRPVVWKRHSVGKDVYEIEIVASSAANSQKWICKREKGETSIKGKATTFELALAIRLDRPIASSFLHSYFPTSLRLPFPALFHATLELASNRKAIREKSDRNDAVLRALAHFYARVLKQLVRSKQIANAIDFLARDKEFPDPLKTFEEEVYEAVRPLELIPTMRGRRLSAKTVRRGPAGYERHLPGRLFADLAKSRNASDLAVMGRLGIEILKESAVLRVLRAAELTMEERATVIAGVARTIPLSDHVKWKWLLVDQHERAFAPRNTPFPPPANETKLPELPTWASSKFIHPKLWRLLMRRVEGQTPREKIRQLYGFGLTEYSNESIIASLRQQAARTLARRGADQGLVQRQLLQTVFDLYDPHNRTPPGTFKVCSADGVWREAKELHLSAEYGTTGRINAALYASAPELLLAKAKENGIVDAARDPAQFFIWIGVNEWPRTATVVLPNNLRQRLLEVLPAEVTVSDSNSHQSFQKNEIQWAYNFVAECSMIVGLENILGTADSDAILAWLGQDPRFDQASPEPFATSAKGRKGGASGFRKYHGPLPDIVRGLISDTPWLACKDDTRRAPAESMVQPLRLAELFSVPRPAAVGSDERYGLTHPIWRRGLENASVPQNLAHLSEGRLFDIFRGLKDREVNGDVVRRLYQQVLELETFDADRALSERQEFLRHGKLLVRKGHERIWVRPSEALYVDQTGFPAAARDFLALIELPPRRNTGNVEERFGVKAFSQQQHRIEVISIDEERGALAAMLRSTFDRTKPFIRALRASDGSPAPRLRRFERLRLCVAHTVEIAVTLGSQRRFEGSLDLWSHVLRDDELVVTIDNRLSPAQAQALAHEAVADGIAEVLELQSGADFSKLLSAPDDGLRSILLHRMLPDLSDQEMDELLADFDLDDEHYDPVQVDASTLSRSPAAPLTSPPVSPLTPTVDTNSPAVRPENPSAVSASKVDHGKTVSLPDPGLRRKLLVRVGGGTGPLSGSAPLDPYRAGDAEEWASMFEESEGRYPLDVDHLRGQGAYGCDRLSFESASDRAAFMEDPKRTDLVARFIEVKSGSIELTETEVRSAEMRGARYFIYRIVFDDASRDSADLTMLADPIAYRQALLARYEFRIDAVDDRQRYQLQAVSDFAKGEDKFI